MELLSTDLLIVERGGVQYHMDADKIKAFVRADSIVADIPARDALAGEEGRIVYVVDASDDPTVDAGGAKYIYDGTTYIKTGEDESFDVVIADSDLSYVASPTGGTVTNTAGTNAAIPVVTSTNAGLATPAMLGASHDAAAAALTPATNPVTVAADQTIGFSISQLAPLP